MFIERDTGPRDYFQVPLTRAAASSATRTRLPGLARTVRGPVMSATPGKVLSTASSGPRTATSSGSG